MICHREIEKLCYLLLIVAKAPSKRGFTDSLSPRFLGYGAIQINAGSLMLKRTNFVAHHSSFFDFLLLLDIDRRHRKTGRKVSPLIIYDFYFFCHFLTCWTLVDSLSSSNLLPFNHHSWCCCWEAHSSNHWFLCSHRKSNVILSFRFSKQLPSGIRVLVQAKSIMDLLATSN